MMVVDGDTEDPGEGIPQTWDEVVRRSTECALRIN